MDRHYSPFDKEIHDLKAADLERLRFVPEGWYVEYKRDVPETDAIAKCIAAFANTYGGWLFLGIDEKGKGTNYAGSFPGVGIEEVDKAKQNIRQAAAQSLTPTPHFDLKVLEGPCAEIELEAGRAIICVHVPWSANTPFLHRSGRIYRRVGDSSEPRGETDRTVLDQLFARRKPTERQIKKWIQRVPDLGKGNRGTYVRILLSPDLWKEKAIRLDVPIRKLKELLEANKKTYNIPMDTVHPVPGGYAFRQVADNDPTRLGFYCRVLSDMSTELIVPVNSLDFASVKEAEEFLSGYKNTERFCRLLRERGFRGGRVLDLNHLCMVLMGLSQALGGLLDHVEYNGPLFFKVQLINAHRAAPFFDTESAMTVLEEFGVPVSFDRKTLSPAGFAPSTFVRMDPLPNSDDANVRNTVLGVMMFFRTAMAFGVEIYESDEGDDDFAENFSRLMGEFLDAAQVAMERASKD